MLQRVGRAVASTLLFGLLAACAGPDTTPTATISPTADLGEPQPTAPAQQPPAAGDVTFTLETALDNGRLVFMGVGGDIDGVVNPTLRVPENTTVTIELINGDGAEHDVAFPDKAATSERITGRGSQTTVTFESGEPGTFLYFCTVPGHRAAGMEGQLIVGEPPSDEQPAGADIVRAPTDVPDPIGSRDPQEVTIDLTATELDGMLAEGVPYTYWTFDDTVPGPFLRVRVGDTVTLNLTNAIESAQIHSIDLHAVNGPGGGADLTQVPPGETKTFTFTPLNPGLYVYHCATPSVPHHIANGMYGLILVEPEGGLPPVDREFYVMQGEVYTDQPMGEQGHAPFSMELMLDEMPEYFVMNGAAAALTTEEYALRANVGETARIFFGVGGPNKISSFHVIGEVFDRVYDEGSLTAEPLTDVQSTLVPVGGSTMVEFEIEVPGRYILVDHALSRVERGAVGYLYAEGAEDPEIFREGP